jgi:hypothetical protein
LRGLGAAMRSRRTVNELLQLIVRVQVIHSKLQQTSGKLTSQT